MWLTKTIAIFGLHNIKADMQIKVCMVAFFHIYKIRIKAIASIFVLLLQYCSFYKRRLTKKCCVNYFKILISLFCNYVSLTRLSTCSESEIWFEEP